MKDTPGSRKFLSLFLDHATCSGPRCLVSHSPFLRETMLASAVLKTSPTHLYNFSRLNHLRKVLLPCGLVHALCTLHIFCSAFSPINKTSARRATLDTGGWRGLTGQGLAPCKKRQASLAAPTSRSIGRRQALRCDHLLGI